MIVSTATHTIALKFAATTEGITLEKPTSGAVTEMLEDKGRLELRFNVLLAQSTNFQHT